ncbi:unnamed protein product, partial [Hymenolepis diminuta]
SIPLEKRVRLRLDAVVVLSERPGYTEQLLIGYSSGVCLLYDLHGDRVLAILPCQYDLESATWCGGSGLPVRGAASNPTQTPPHLGTRLLTAYGNGSLGVWQVPRFATGLGLAKELSAQVLQMLESPSMPYGPFPCKLISKVFWLPSHKGGITVFAGGLPRSIYANRNTVSILRGSNLDQAAAANITAALRADSEGEYEDSGGEEDAFDQTGDDVMLASGLVPGAPVHVFDSDAPEHVCLDFPSPVVDVCPLGPAGGPVSGLLVLCEEEIVAVDLLTPGWPILELPYLNCLHASSITAYGLFTQVDPVFLEGLESIGGKADAAGRIPKAPGISTRPWPIKGGHETAPSNCNTESLMPSNDLLITGHEDGVVKFWRLAAGNCARKIFSLFTGSLFEGEFGPDALGDINRDVDEAEPWPPFRRVGLFDPFMDDVRAAVKVIQLVDRTLVVGGAAGQVSVWQLLKARPTMATLDVPITTEVPGFRWKGHAPLTLRQQQPDPTQHLSGGSLFPIAVALCQPPSPVTCLSVCELNDKPNGSSNQQQNALESSIGVLVGMGSAHGFALMHLKLLVSGEATGRSFTASLVLHHSTIPANAEALEEASVGDGWARRRTRELKNSLRDSFRRLKRMKSGRSTAHSPPATPSVGAKPAATGSPPTASRFNDSARVGLRKSVTRSTSGATRSIQPRGSPEAIVSSIHGDGVDGSMMPFPTGGEREICDRPTATANTALVRCMTFGPPLHHRLRPPTVSSTNTVGTVGNSTGAIETPHLLASFFAGTSGGAALVYALFADDTKRPVRISARQATQMQLQHRAPIVTLRLIDTKTHCPLMNSSIYLPTFSAPHHTSSSHHSQQPPPHLIVISEEQVRLFALPSISLKQKARITAKDGFRIKTGDIIAFGQAPGERGPGLYGIEFDCVFTNNGGQAVVLSVPHLRRRDTIALLGGSDVLEINSVVFATAASTQPKIIGAPSLGVYQIAPGQLAMFDVVLAGQKCSPLGSAYRTAGQTRQTVNCNTLSPSPRLQRRLVKARADADARSSPSRANGNGL